MAADMTDCSREQYMVQSGIDLVVLDWLGYSGYNLIDCSIAGPVIDVAVGHRKDEGRHVVGRVYSSTAGVE
jgi:hypothetical protein